eukprot:192690_1
MDDDNNNYPKCIYVSPTERTLGTAMQIAMSTKLPIIVVPGLSSCAAAVKRGGLIKINMNKKKKLNTLNEEKQNDDVDDVDDKEKDYELFLNDYGWIGRCNFLSKKEILNKFGQNGV